MVTLPPQTSLVRHLGGGATFAASLLRGPKAPVESGPDARLFVLKRPLPYLRERPEGGLALAREWAALKAFDPRPLPQIPRPVFRGTDVAGPYLAETFLEGDSLREIRLASPRGLSAQTFRDVALATSRALAELHEYADERGPLGFVHGDIAPSNLLFETKTGRIGFIDFATSTFRDASEPVFPRSMSTLPYSAPELARGEALPSAATDTYALAATLASLVVDSLTDASTGGPLLVEIAERGLRLEALRAPSDSSPRLHTVLAEALAFSPRERLASSREFAEALAANLDR